MFIQEKRGKGSNMRVDRKRVEREREEEGREQSAAVYCVMLDLCTTSSYNYKYYIQRYEENNYTTDVVAQLFICTTHMLMPAHSCLYMFV